MSCMTQNKIKIKSLIFLAQLEKKEFWLVGKYLNLKHT